MIDLASGFLELHSIGSKKIFAASRKADSQWLCRYPRSLEVKCDHGNEILACDFKEFLKSCGLNTNMMKVKNLQSKAILELAHAAINNHLRFPRTLDAKQIMQDSNTWKHILMSVTFAINSTDHTALNMIPRQLVFGRDMTLNDARVAN